MFVIKYVIMFEHTNVQMFKSAFVQNNVITNVRNIVINNAITFIINKYRKRILFTCLFCFVLLEATEFLAKHA